MKLHASLIATIAALGLMASAIAQPIVFNFDTSAQNFQNMTWSSTGPSGWSGGAAVQAPATVGGWTLGGSFNYRHEFDWASGEQPVMQAISASGAGHVSFDVILDGTSFPNNSGTWYSINVAGNSAGSGWTQIEGVTGGGWRNAGDTALVSTHVDLTFAQLAWNEPLDASGWFQLNFGANSDAANPVKFYLDNVTVYMVPEPSALALAGVGVLALAILRRRG